MSGRLSRTLVGEWMTADLAVGNYVALFTDDPFVPADPTTVEVIGTVVRQPAAWTLNDPPYSVTLASDIVFENIPAQTTVRAIGAYRAATGSSGILFRDMLSQPIYFPTGGSWSIPAGGWIIGIDIPV